MNMETWAHIRHLFFVENLPKKAIARKLNLDPKTVRNALNKETFSHSYPIERTSKLDDFKEKIDELIKEYPGISGTRIYEEVKKMGYEGGISVLRDYLRTVRNMKKTSLNIHTTPAEEAQVDWAYTGTLPSVDSSKRVYCFVMVLSFSGMMYIQFFHSQTIENFMIGHVNAFSFFGGVPKRIRYDNLKSVVIHRAGSNVRFNPRFLDFASHYLFNPSVCNVKSPHEKGRVERAVRYVKENFLKGRTFLSITDCNNQSVLWRDHVANCRIHGTTKRRPLDLFEKEKPLLTPLPGKKYDTRIVSSAKSTSQSLIKFQTNRYSVPFTYASKTLTVKADDQSVYIYDREKLITKHKRCYKKYQTVEDPGHVKGLISSRPKAMYFKHRDAILAMGQIARTYLEEMSKTELRYDHQLKKIMDIVDLFGKTEVLAAMEHAMKYDAFGHEYLRNIILAKRRTRSLKKTPGSPSSKINPELIRSTWVEERDPGIYDTLFDKMEADHEDEEGN